MKKRKKFEFDNQLSMTSDLNDWEVIDVITVKKIKYSFHFFIVFTPALPNEYRYSRFLVSHRQLKKYIGAKNAETTILKMEKMKSDKLTVKFRKFGKLEIYAK